MLTSSLCARLSVIGPVLLPVLLDAAVKGLAILSLTALTVLAMRRASAAARHLVWFLGAASVLILPILSAALPGWHILPQWANNATSPAPIAAPAPVLVPSVPDNQLLPNEAAPPAKPPIFAQMPASPQPLRLTWQTWLLLAWLAGSALLLGYVALGLASLRWLQRRSSRITAGGWPILLRRLCDQLGLGRPVELLSSSRRTMPMTWGIWRTRLLLPEDSVTWTDEQRRTVLLHELAHAKRWDCLTQLVVQLACAVYWFNPLLWLAWKRMQSEREQACDDLVLSAGTKASAYAEQLLHIASEMPVVRFSAAAIAMARPSKLEGRLLAILDVTRNRRGLSIRACAVTSILIAALAVPLAMVRAAAPPKTHIIDPNENAANAAAQTDLAKSVKPKQLKAIAFADVLDYLRDICPANIVVNWNAAKSAGVNKTAPVTISLQNINLAAALENILQQVSNGKLDYAIFQGVILITTPQEIQNLQRSPPHKPRIIGQPDTAENKILKSRLEGIPGGGERWITFSFGDVINFLRDTSDANIVVDWDTAKTAGIDPTDKLPEMLLDNVKLSNLLTILLSQQLPGKLDYAVFDGVIVISTPEQLERLARTAIAIPGNANAKLQAALDRTLDLPPVYTKLQDYIFFLGDITGAKIRVRWDKLQSVGVNEKTPVTLSLRNVKFSSVLELLLIQPGLGKLAYIANGDTITISTAEDLNPAGLLPATDPAASNNTGRVRHFVMLVIAPDGGMTFQGTQTSWDKLPALLEQVPDRSHTVLCLAWTSNQVTVGQLNEARASQLAQQFGFEYLSIVGEHPLGATGGPDKLIEDVQGAPAGGGAEPLVQTVNKNLSDFPGGTDLSTPQSAWAAWTRAGAAMDGKAEAALSWRKLDPDDERRWWEQERQEDPNGIYPTALANSHLIEVWVYRKEFSDTISYLPFPEGKGRDPYSLRSFGVIGGTWKNLGEDRCGSLDEARETVRAKLPWAWSDFQEIKSSWAPPPTTAPAAQAAIKQEAGKTIVLYVHNGVMCLRMGDKVVQAKRIEFDPVGGPRLVAEADGNVVRLVRDGDERNIAGLGVRIEIAPDGQIAAEGGIIRLMQNALEGAPDSATEPAVQAGGAAPEGAVGKLHRWVEDFFKHNYRDITSRKTLEWGEPQTTNGGNLSIRYKFDAVIWDKDILTMNQVFTFTSEGKFVSVKDVEGFPLKHGVVPLTTRPAVAGDKIEDALHQWVEKFFSRNYRDITARTSIEWGKPQKRPDGNWQIRYKYQATIWDKDRIVCDKFFAFTPTGEFVEVKDAQPPATQPAM
ncbi:MAG: M56 family metallopeptidase [Tepidisphaeraceae bacterium]